MGIVVHDRTLPLLDPFLEQLQEALGEEIEALPLDAAAFRIRLKSHPRAGWTGVLRDRGSLTPEEARHFGMLGDTLAARGDRLLLMAGYVPPEAARILAEKRVAFVDRSGNLRLDLERPRVRIWVEGRRPAPRPRKMAGRLLEPSGLRVIHELLTHGDSLHLPYRTIAPRAGVSFATVGIVLRALEEAGHLVGRRTRLEGRESLVDLFVRGYALKLRPGLLVGRFRHPRQDDPDFEERIVARLRAAQGCWALAGAAAARRWTNWLRSPELAIFADEVALAALRDEPLLPDPSGGLLTLFRHFGSGVNSPAVPGTGADTVPIVTPLLAYAELLHDGRPRELEAAALLRKQVFTPEGADGR